MSHITLTFDDAAEIADMICDFIKPEWLDDIQRAALGRLADALDEAEASYKCPVCGSTDPTHYLRCDWGGCPDGRDRMTEQPSGLFPEPLIIGPQGEARPLSRSTP